MTDPGSFDVDPPARLTLVGTEAAQAVQAADAAALAAAVTVREVTELVELQDVVRLFSAIWGRDANPPMTVELLRAFTLGDVTWLVLVDIAYLVGLTAVFLYLADRRLAKLLLK